MLPSLMFLSILLMLVGGERVWYPARRLRGRTRGDAPNGSTTGSSVLSFVERYNSRFTFRSTPG
jgi:hypothetical protein